MYFGKKEVRKMLKGAIIGTGFIGASHAEAYRAAAGAELAAIVEMNGELGKKTAEAYGVPWYKTLRELSENETVDILNVCVPTFLHEEIVVEAASYGFNILCEKPVTFTLESFDRMAGACRENNVQFMVAQVIRFWPEYEVLAERYRGGGLGEIYAAYFARMSEFPKWSTWHHLPEKSGGALYDLVLHDLDFAQYLFGDVATVRAAGHRTPAGCWDTLQALVAFKNGAHAVVEGSDEMYGGFPFTMLYRVQGSGATLDYRLNAGHNLEDVEHAVRSLYAYRPGQEYERVAVEAYDAYAKEIEYFAEIIQSGKENDKVSVESSRKTLELVLAVKEALETGKTVKLP